MLEDVDDRGRVRGLAPRLVMALALVGAGLGPVHAATDPTDAIEPAGTVGAAGALGDNPAAGLVPQNTVRQRKRVAPLDRRVNLLAKELGLDATQKARVKKVLERQREQIARVWNDSSIPPARRVSATQAIGDQTADRIRALLNEEQRKKYIQPRKRDVAAGTPGADVEAWMNAAKRK